MLAYYHATKSKPEFIIKKRLRNNLNRIGNAVKRERNTSLTEKLLGCSFAFFKEYIESQFKKGMTWANYATHWHIDHIVPLSAFDLTNPDQVLIATNWNNLRPLSIRENLSKGSKVTEPQVFLPLMFTKKKREPYQIAQP
jgi:5-methylcytosine-specific restriction endonuclease McrA